jgi:hypothetical protein
MTNQDKSEIYEAITQSMIDAGKAALEGWDSRVEAPDWIREQIVVSVYEAMACQSRGVGVAKANTDSQ